MNRSYRMQIAAISTAAAFTLIGTGCSSMHRMHDAASTSSAAATLSGAQEVPPNQSSATGKSTIRIASDMSVSGSVTYTGMTATMAHIHQGAKGKNGPVIIPLTKTSDNTFSVPANTKLSEAQYAAYKTGDLYVNVHSAAYPGGEIRLQLMPQ